MKNIKEQFSEQMGFTVRYLNYLLRGEKDAGKYLAKKLVKRLGGNSDTWQFGEYARERSVLWEAYLAQHKEQSK